MLVYICYFANYVIDIQLKSYEDFYILRYNAV
jgi:hypothetical protein